MKRTHDGQPKGNNRTQKMPPSDHDDCDNWMKWLSNLTNSKAKEVTPCEVGDRMWKESVHSLTSDSHRLLQQTTCIILTPILMKKLGFVDVIDGLVNQGFEFVGGRVVWFTQEQAEHFLCLIDAGNFQQLPMLTSGGCIILALQRDNAVLAFDSLLRETFSTEDFQGKSVTDSLLHKYGSLILRPSDIRQAHSLLGYFFDELLPSSHIQVLPKQVE